MKIFLKKLTVPATNETKEIEVAQLWEVRWTSRHGEYSHSVEPELEAFPSKEAAEEFATSLRNAFDLLHYGIWKETLVKVTKAR
jgi:hypothetical protein